VARKTLAEADEDFWTEVMALNFDSLRRVTKAATPHLIAAAKSAGGASIVNISSLAGRKGGHAGSLPYSTSKGAVLTFTRALAAELGSYGVRVNAVAPGAVATPMALTDHHNVGGGMPATLRARVPMHRYAAPGEIAGCVAFLLSDQASYITGSTLLVDGGFSTT